MHIPNFIPSPKAQRWETIEDMARELCQRSGPTADRRMILANIRLQLQLERMVPTALGVPADSPLFPPHVLDAAMRIIERKADEMIVSESALAENSDVRSCPNDHPAVVLQDNHDGTVQRVCQQPGCDYNVTDELPPTMRPSPRPETEDRSVLLRAVDEVQQQLDEIRDYRRFLACAGTVDWRGEQVADWAKHRAEKALPALGTIREALLAAKDPAPSPSPDPDPDSDSFEQRLAAIDAKLDAFDTAKSRCSHCRRKIAKDVRDVMVGALCPRKWASRDPEAEADCKAAAEAGREYDQIKDQAHALGCRFTRDDYIRWRMATETTKPLFPSEEDTTKGGA